MFINPKKSQIKKISNVKDVEKVSGNAIIIVYVFIFLVLIVANVSLVVAVVEKGIFYQRLRIGIRKSALCIKQRENALGFVI